MSASESNPGELSICVGGSRAIRDAVEAARAFGLARKLARPELARLCIVVEELTANLYDHGGVTEEDELHLRFADDARGILVSIVAPGDPFDPWSTLPSSEDRLGGGAGVNLIRAWSELVAYRPSNGTHDLQILVRLARND